MASLHLIGGEKGGVGKSVMSRVLAQYCIDRGLPFTGFDTDRSHSTFLRFYRDFAQPTVVDDYTSLDLIAEAVTADPERQVLVDLAAQTMPPLQRWIDESGVLELMAETGNQVRFWHVMDDGRDSLGMLEALLNRFGSSVAYTVVLNFGRGSDFSAFQASETKANALALGASVIELRKLHEASMHKIDLHDASFWAAAHGRGAPESLGLLERQRVKMWLSRTYEDLAPFFVKPA
jgi:hypothetical protein